MAKLTNVFSKEAAKTERHPKRTMKWVHYTKLRSSKYQYCDAKEKEEIETLADSIEAIGEVLENLLVRKIDADEYEILGGHKRCAACRLLVEERGKEDYAFLPCDEKKESEARSHFMVLASNIHHIETAYEKMHKLTTMKKLIENYPEEFPDVQSGRMVERLAKMCDMKRTTVGEYLSIAKNLGAEAMEAFKEGRIEKSAAVTLAGMPEEIQSHALGLGITTDTALKEYKKENLEPSGWEILLAYEFLHIAKHDEADRKKVVEKLSAYYPKNAVESGNGFDFESKGAQLVINGKTITWNRFRHLLDEYKPYVPQAEHLLPGDKGRTPKLQMTGQMEIVNTDMETVENTDIPDFGTVRAAKEAEKGVKIPEKEDPVSVKELPGHYIMLCFGTYGQAETLFLINYSEEPELWCCYLPSCEHGFNLSATDRDANGRKLSADIQDAEVCHAVNDTVWELMHRKR